MRPKKIVYDTAFEKKFEKYKRQLTEAERKRLKTRLRKIGTDTIYFKTGY